MNTLTFDVSEGQTPKTNKTLVAFVLYTAPNNKNLNKYI